LKQTNAKLAKTIGALFQCLASPCIVYAKAARPAGAPRGCFKCPAM